MSSLSDTIKRFTDTISRESPTILTSLGVTGLVSTTILAVKATPKAVHLIDQEMYERQDDTPLPPIEVVKLTWKCYIPTVAVGVATAACIIGANHISLRRNAALMSLYSLTESTLKEYQEKVIEVIGDKKEEEIRDGIAQDRLNRNPIEGREIIFTGSGDSLFYDNYSGRYFRATVESIRKAQNDFNYLLMQDMYLPLNDFYEAIGLEGVEGGRDMGWNIEDGLLDVRMTAKIATNDQPCIVLDYSMTPKKL